MRREKKKAETKRALTQAAHALFLERGYDAVTIDEIAEAAGVSRRTFFRYFPTKEAVVFPHHAERVEAFRMLLQAADPELTGFGAVRRAALAMGAQFQADKKEMLTQYRIVIATPALIGIELMLDRRFEEAMVAAVLEREGKSAATRRRALLVASATIGVVRTTLREWYERGCKDDLVKLGEEGFATLEAGLGPQRRVKR